MLNIIGNIFTNDGYGSHTRQLANALYKYTDVKLSTAVPQFWERYVNDAELNMIKKQVGEIATNLIITTPHNWKLYLGLGKNLCYCVWEGDCCPLSYLDEFNNDRVTYILVPSNHTRQAILNTLKKVKLEDNIKEKIINKIQLIPHGIDRKIFHNLNLPKTDDKFKFFCNKGWRGTSWDRGGVQYLLKAFAEEFKKDEKVKLVLKLNPAYINPNDIKISTDKLNLPEDRAEINICCDNLSLQQINELYNQCDVYVCPTRAEAFNLPGLEAMSCGLPTIQTTFGGQTDYMTNENSLFIDYDLEEVKEDVMYESISWATPRIEHLRKQMRWCFENKEDIKQMGKQAEEDSMKWTWDNSAKIILGLLE